MPIITPIPLIKQYLSFQLHIFFIMVNARNVCFETLYGGQFTLLTQLIILNYPVILSHRRPKKVEHLLSVRHIFYQMKIFTKWANKIRPEVKKDF